MLIAFSSNIRCKSR